MRTLTDATETWLVAEAYKDSKPDEFKQILVSNQLYDLWQLCECESEVNSVVGEAYAEFWASKILTSLGCDNVDEVFELALSLDQYDLVPDATYVAGHPEYATYRQFIERAFAGNREEKTYH